MDPLIHFKNAPFTDKCLAYIIVKFRWLFVAVFLLPISVLYNIFYGLRNRIVFFLTSAPKLHNYRVKNIQSQIRKWNNSGRKQKMCTSRPGWQTMSFRIGKYKSTLYNVNINLVDILELDIERKIVRVEPMVNMKQITSTLLPKGWTLPIVPELDDLTVGGLIMGTGVETSSHRYGLFQHICLSLELVMQNGELIKCSPEENSELFYAAFWSYGTLGFLVAAELKIIPTKKFVKIEYRPYLSKLELVRDFQNQSLNTTDNDFVEGLVYSENTGVILVGNMVDEAPYNKINSIGKYYKSWFYKHVEAILQEQRSTLEYIPLVDYYHRHSRSIFWEMQDIIPFGNHWLFRYLFGWTVPPKISLLKLTQGETVKVMYEKCQMIQDMLVPLSKLDESLSEFHNKTQIYPLWLCPFKLKNQPGLVQPKLLDDNSLDSFVMYVDIGAYGVVKSKDYQAEETTRSLEAFVRSVDGYQMLYADSYMTRDEFYQMFHHKLYESQRKKYHCDEAFPDIYDKISKSARI